MERAHGSEELPLERLAQDDVEEGVDAAVSVAHANGYVVGVGEGQARLLHAQMDQLQDVVGGPADEECQTDGHGHAGDLPRAHPEAPGRQRCDASGHVLEDLEEDHADDGQRDGERQEKLVEGEPVGVGGRQEESAGHQAVRQPHEAGVHPHGCDGKHGEPPHQHDDQDGHAGRADVVEADGVDGGQVAVQGHGGQDVGADDLTVGVQRRDDHAHGGTKVPGAVAQQLVDEEGHPEEEEEVGDGQVQDEDVWDRLLGAALGLLHDGVDDDAVAHDAQEADDGEDDWQDGAVVETSVHGCWMKQQQQDKVSQKKEKKNKIRLSQTGRAKMMRSECKGFGSYSLSMASQRKEK